MALIALAADKGAPGVTTAALALASVWPRPVLLAECDPAGGDLVFRFPAADGRQLDPRRGLLSLAVAGRRDYQQQQVWPHVQKLSGGLDVLLGVTSAEQGTGLSTLWRPLGALLAGLPEADVIADCGRLGPDGPPYDLLAQADAVVLITRPDLGDIIRLRDRATAVMAAADRRGRRGMTVSVLVVADPKTLKDAEAEVTRALAQSGVPVRLASGIAHDPKGADLLRGTWGGRLDKTLLIRTAREVAGQLAAPFTAQGVAAPPAQGQPVAPGMTGHYAPAQAPGEQPHEAQPAAAHAPAAYSPRPSFSPAPAHSPGPPAPSASPIPPTLPAPPGPPRPPSPAGYPEAGYPATGQPPPSPPPAGPPTGRHAGEVSRGGSHARQATTW